MAKHPLNIAGVRLSIKTSLSNRTVEGDGCCATLASVLQECHYQQRGLFMMQCSILFTVHLTECRHASVTMQVFSNNGLKISYF